MDSWDCKRCTLTNVRSSSACVACGSPKLAALASNPAPPSPKAAPPPPPKPFERTWDCSKCTFKNQAKTATCAMCATTKATRKPLSVAQPREERKWQCKACTLLNGSASQRCTACGSARVCAPPRAPEPTFKGISDDQMAFFHKYGFVVIRGLHTAKQVDTALAAATRLIYAEMNAKDGGKGEQAFGELPEGSRSTWARCTDPGLTQLFTFPKNEKMMRGLVGAFEFKHFSGPGFYTFAPRFHQWAQNPTSVAPRRSVTVAPFDTKGRMPDSDFGKGFVRRGAALGMRFAASRDDNWHLDGEDYEQTMTFSILWGCYINALPNGGMGNLQVYPGSHHVLANVMRKRGAHWAYNGKVRPAPTMRERPNLRAPGLCDGKPYQVCVDAGDVVIAHPWLAHGIGTNSSDKYRLACYCRLVSGNFFWPPQSCARAKVAGRALSRQPWVDKIRQWKGDYLANVPGVRAWVDRNSRKIREFDGGELEQALARLS